MKLPVYNKEGEIVEEIEFPEEIANLEFNENLVHQAARWQMMNSYFPYAHTKTRGEVRGGGRKPWPQKHTLHTFFLFRSFKCYFIRQSFYETLHSTFSFLKDFYLFCVKIKLC
jgi:hypothetical protein